MSIHGRTGAIRTCSYSLAASEARAQILSLGVMRFGKAKAESRRDSCFPLARYSTFSIRLSSAAQFLLGFECCLEMSDGEVRNSNIGFYAVALCQISAVFHDLRIKF